MSAAVRDAYLARLGLDAESPSVDALFALHRAHVERVAYETLWIHLGEGWSVDTSESTVRIATRGRGGYCFHLNGALSELLRALGYDVVRHVGGVHGPDGPSPEEMTNHLVLTVHGLPERGEPGRRLVCRCRPRRCLARAAPADSRRVRPGPVPTDAADRGRVRGQLGPDSRSLGFVHRDGVAFRGSSASLRSRRTTSGCRRRRIPVS